MEPSLDLIDSLTQVFVDFRSAWFLGIVTLCYLFINLLRGKAGFVIPYVTPWLEKQPKEIKTYAILLFFALAGTFTAFSAEKVTFTVILNGFLEGLTFGVGANGARNVIKQGIEGSQAYLENKKKTTDQNGSAQ